MEWGDDVRGEQAELLRWLIDEYESGRLTAHAGRWGDSEFAPTSKAHRAATHGPSQLRRVRARRGGSGARLS